MELAEVEYTDETGSIWYYITGTVRFGIRIEQERGILTAAQTEYFSDSYEETASFVKSLAKGKATAVSLYDLCDDCLF